MYYKVSPGGPEAKFGCLKSSPRPNIGRATGAVEGPNTRTTGEFVEIDNLTGKIVHRKLSEWPLPNSCSGKDIGVRRQVSGLLGTISCDSVTCADAVLEDETP